MNQIEEYINFSIKYKILVGNYLPIEMKRYIWNIYLKMISLDKICAFIQRNIKQCEDCYSNRLPMSLKYHEACTESVVDNYKCCYKLTCKNGCKFVLNCGCIKHILPDELYNSTKIVVCCNITNNLNLTWWGLTIREYLDRY